MTNALSILRDTFGYPSFRGQQGEIINHVASGGNALVLLPTGEGKSLCYQIPALMRPGTAIVVTPLIALMQDQVVALKERGVCAAALNSSLPPASQRKVKQNFARGDYDLLYVSPERLLSPDFLRLLKTAAARNELALFAIDEAHCISLWGHDFRTEYLELSLLAKQFPRVPRIALTATADPLTYAEIIKYLHLDDGRVFTASLDRLNIRYEIVKKDKVRSQLLSFIRERHEGDSGIVYCLAPKTVEATATFLSSNGIRALPYHGEMGTNDRRDNQNVFMTEPGTVMVATIAFGMGIDKPDVRFVAHIDLPGSIEAYYQETGRAGRDGLPADAWMAYGDGDENKQKHMIYSKTQDEYRQRVLTDKLDALLGLCEIPTCRRVVLLACFGQPSKPCGNCDNCLAPPLTWDASIPVRQALRCVERTGNCYAAAYIIRLLMGESSDRAIDLQHDKLEEFGIGADRPVDAWRGILRQMLAMGLLTIIPLHRWLRLTDAGRAALKDSRRIALRLLPINPERASKPTAAGHVSATDDEAALKRLLDWRSHEARIHRCLPDEVISRAALVQLSRHQPKTLAALGRIAGFGSIDLTSRTKLFELVTRPDGTDTQPERSLRLGRGIGNTPLPLIIPEDQVIFYRGEWLAI